MSNGRPTPEDVRQAWQRELPGVPNRSIGLVWAIKDAAAVLRRARAEALREAGVDAATLDLLATLRRAGPPYVLRTHELADRCLVTPGAMSQRLSRAEQDGLVERRPAAARRVDVALTDAGHDVVERVTRGVLQADEALTATLDDEELAQLESVLTRWLGGLPASLR